MESNRIILKNEGMFITILTLIQFSHILDFVIMMPLGPQLMRIMNISPREFSLMVSAYTFSASICGFLSALFIDKFDRKKSLQIIYGGFIGGTLFCALAPNFYALVIGRVIAGGFGGIIGGLIFSILGDTIPFERRGAATGKIMSAFSIASVIGVPIGLGLANIFSWHAPFIMLVVLSLTVLVSSSIYIPTMSLHINIDTKENDFKEVFRLFKTANHNWAFLLMIILMFGSFSVIPFISPVMIFNVGLTEAELPYIYLIGGAFTFFTARLVGHLSDRFGKTRMFMILAISSILPLVFLTNITRTSFAIAVTCTTGFMILTSGRAIPAMALITASSSTKVRGRFMSLNSSLQQLSSGIASFTAGLIVKTGPNKEILHYNIVGYIGVIAVILSLFVIKKINVHEVSK